jgi:SAM-dependent methyltransferase
MSLDVVDLRSFYASALGRVAHRFVGAIIGRRWENCTGLSMLGVGYATPYLSGFRDSAVRVLAFMPAEQGVVNWPEDGASSSALVDATMMPLPDACIDRVLVVHALELSESPGELLSEIWRILTPGGRVLIVAPNRRGVWAQLEATPFGQGRPYSRGQLRELLRDTLFSPIHEAEALYVPPFGRPYLLRMASAFERMGERFGLPGGGVHVIEATKQLYRPIGARKVARRPLPQLEPALSPTPAGIGFGSRRSGEDQAAR